MVNLFKGRSESTTQGKKEPVKALIVYGSSRGTTAKIAEAIAEGMEAAGASASAISVELLRLVPDRVRTVDILGIGSPVYFLREPRYMTEFVSSLGMLESKKAFVFCTCGMDRVGETLRRLHTMLSEQGAAVIGAKHFRSAMSYFPHRKRGFGNPDHLPDDSELTAARNFGEQMTHAIDLDPVSLAPPSLATRLKAQLLGNKRFRSTLFPGVRLNAKECTGYGSCLTRCPFNGLARKDGEDIPFITDNCVQCLECIADCPRGAIVIDSRTKEWLSTLSYRWGIH